MAIPTREQAERVLAEAGLPEGILVHSRGVTRVACEAARLVAGGGIPVNGPLVEVAALLHDIDKPETRAGAGEHGVVGGARMIELGWEELALPIASHPVAALLDDDRHPKGWESVIVSVADRHVAQEFMTIDERIDDLIGRYPQYRVSLEAARRPAAALEREVADAAGLEVDDLVARLRAAWEAGV